ncbi:MAG: hypothetical protein K1X92_00620 [Bacteroidia bacterium]|nr:hypothetical protein [Bacteroidia bacterium]
MKIRSRSFIYFFLFGLIVIPSSGNSQMLLAKPVSDCGFKHQSDELLHFNPAFIEERAIREISATIQSEPGFSEKWLFDTEGRLTLFFMIAEGDTILKHSYYYTEEEGMLFREYYRNKKNNEAYQLTYRYNSNGTLYQQKKFNYGPKNDFHLYETIYYFYDGLQGSPKQLRIKKIVNGKTAETCDCFYENSPQKPTKYIVWENEAENMAEKTVSYNYNSQNILKGKNENTAGMNLNTEYFYDSNNLWIGLKSGGSNLRFSYAPNKVLKEIQEKPGFDGKERKYTFSYLFYE